MRMTRFSFLIVFAAFAAHAAEIESAVPNGASHFRLFSSRCEPEASDGPEATPQSPPLEVDDPATPGCNRWEINVVASGDLTRDAKEWELPLLDLNYGIGDNLQLKYEVPNMISQTSEASVRTIGESKVGLKYSFYENETSDTGFAVYPQTSFVSSSSDAVKQGLVSAGSIITLPVLMATTLGKTSLGDLRLTANVGYNHSTKIDTADFVSAAVGIGTPLLNRLAIQGEISTEQAVKALEDSDRQHALKGAVGLVGNISKHVLLFGSVGHSFVSSDQVDHAYVLSGIRFVAGGTSM